MKVIVTCGPSYEPIDRVRRITNASTGELGVLLANQLNRAGHEVFCFKGVMTTYAGLYEGEHLNLFTTNDDLCALLKDVARKHKIQAVFHVAALCDFKVRQIAGPRGKILKSGKIPSRTGNVTLSLEPTKKVIADLRSLFPDASIVGWKYEMDGKIEEALDKAWSQVREYETDACVLNGAAWGKGFAFCVAPDHVESIPGKTQLCKYIVRWIDKTWKAKSN